MKVKNLCKSKREKLKSAMSAVITSARNCLNVPVRYVMAVLLFLVGVPVFGQDVSAANTAFDMVTDQIVQYIPMVRDLCYAIAGVVALVGAISVYIAMNNDEQDVKKKIMMVVGACLFLIAAAQCLPLFFGL